MSPTPRILLKSVAVSAIIAAFLEIGCHKEPPPGTPENLKADYDRVVREKEDLKAEFEKRKQEIDRTWKQSITDKEQKITDLTADNANLRQRVLTLESAINQTPLVDESRNRSVMWLHFTYSLILACIVVFLAVVLWVHANMRERVRMYIMQQAKLVRSREVINVEDSVAQR